MGSDIVFRTWEIASLYNFSSVDARMLGADGTGGAAGGEGDLSSSAAFDCSEMRLRFDWEGKDVSVLIISRNFRGIGEQLRRMTVDSEVAKSTRQFRDFPSQH